MRFGTMVMKIIKYLLVFLVVLIASATVAIFIAFNRIPSIDGDKAILILGKGGEGHTAPNLTDTIMVAYFNVPSEKVSILSFPRDIWITEIRAKLNTAYHYGGFKMASDSIYSITNKKISNTVVIDFSLFRDLIDAIGGINVDVKNSFVDDKYPIEGKENDLCGGDKSYACRYETITFEAGVQKMNGELALKFVRSRNAKGDEGTDLARERRQQQVISAIQKKIVSSEVLLSPRIINDLYKIVVNHVETDIKPVDVISYIKFSLKAQHNLNLLSFPEDLIEVSQNNKKYDMQYVFVPSGGSWEPVQEWLADKI